MSLMSYDECHPMNFTSGISATGRADCAFSHVIEQLSQTTVNHPWSLTKFMTPTRRKPGLNTFSLRVNVVSIVIILSDNEHPVKIEHIEHYIIEFSFSIVKYFTNNRVGLQDKDFRL